MLKIFFARLGGFGLARIDSVSLKQKVSLTNIVSFVLLAAGLPYIGIFYLVSPFLGLMALFGVTSFLFTPLLNAYGFFTVSRFWMLLVSNLIIFYYSATFGVSSGIHLVFFTLASLSFIVFSFSEWSKIVVGFFGAVFFYYLLYFIDLRFVDAIQLHPSKTQLILFSASAVTFLVNFLYLRFYFASLERLQLQLLSNNEELQKTNKELKERKLMLEKVSQQAAFTSMTMGIAHEIRNPMFSMVTSTEVLTDVADNPDDVRDYAEMIKRNIFRILKITDLMLRYGKPVDHERQIVDVEKMVQDILDLVKAQAKQTKVEISSSFDVPAQVEGDGSQIYQVFMNLILNAVQAMNNLGGTIAITTQNRSFQPAEGEDMLEGVEIKVADTGPGIPEEKIEKIFDPFFTTKYEGTGLGLSIVLKNVQIHFGLIEVESELGKGTTFRVCFPFRSPNSEISEGKPVFSDSDDAESEDDTPPVLTP